jgi:4-hydroxybenzoate polyprenyltransferase
LVNILNRVVDLGEDQKNRIVGTDFVARNAKAIKVAGFLALFLSVPATLWVAGEILPFRVCFHALGFAYNWPLLPGRRRIKALYFWKNTASAIGFMLTVFAAPLASMGFGRRVPLALGVSWASVALLAAFFFLFELSYEVLYDLRDAEGDAAEGIQTYPVVHGEAVALRIVDALVLSSLAIMVAGYMAQVVPWRAAVMGAAPLIQLSVYKRIVARRPIRAQDCIALTWIGAGLLGAYHLWVLAKLPGV